VIDHAQGDYLNESFSAIGSDIYNKENDLNKPEVTLA
jgi:hypothetical protein